MVKMNDENQELVNEDLITELESDSLNNDLINDLTVNVTELSEIVLDQQEQDLKQKEDLTNLVKVLEKQLEKDSEKIKVDGKEKTGNEVLGDILSVLTLPDKNQLKDSKNTLDQMKAINDSLDDVNSELKLSQEIVVESNDNLNKTIQDSSVFLSVTIVVALSVYLFFNQIGKW